MVLHRQEHIFEIPKKRNPMRYTATRKTTNNGGHWDFYIKLYSKGHWKRSVRRSFLFRFPALKPVR